MSWKTPVLSQRRKEILFNKCINEKKYLLRNMNSHDKRFANVTFQLNCQKYINNI